jgi:hypothetical protein
MMEEAHNMADYDLEHCLRRVAEYEATRYEPGFDEQRLLDMKTGCARRRALDGADLTADQEKVSRELIENERPDLWS